eukprot:TRINITY_DN561_c0_g1_i1.p1 TRINITY_DN561_c0_g1~~TRINITY_DN561_c0_g1_i1.p1  ORF type:complete len:119 (+),score=18.62 TRINITY_DN561_c0_g1_i1:175-531(+)
MEVKHIYISFSLMGVLLSFSLGSPLPQREPKANIIEVKDQAAKKLIFDSFNSGRSVLYESLFPNIDFKNVQVGQTVYETNIEVESPRLVLHDDEDEPSASRRVSSVDEPKHFPRPNLK